MEALELTEKYIIDTILEEEKIAEETYLVDLDSKLFKIKFEAIDENDFIKMVANFYANQIKNYREIKNLYKATNDEFNWINDAANGKLTEDTRLELIAQTLKGCLIGVNSRINSENAISIKESLNVINQLQNLPKIVFETHSAKLKFQYCKDKVREIKAEVQSKQANSIKERLTSKRFESQDEHALFIIYNRINLNDQNKNELAAKEGYTSKYSGHKLYQLYNKFIHETNRTKHPGTNIKLKNQIYRVKNVINHLKDEAKEVAKKDLSELNKIAKISGLEI